MELTIPDIDHEFPMENCVKYLKEQKVFRRIRLSLRWTDMILLSSKSNSLELPTTNYDICNISRSWIFDVSAIG
jgi:hypothetical protein